MNAGAGFPRRARPIRHPRAGDLVKLTAVASVQFAGACTAWFRIIRIDPRPTYAGWIWLIGYTIDAQGKAIERREVFVQIAGLIFVAPGGAPWPVP